MAKNDVQFGYEKMATCPYAFKLLDFSAKAWADNCGACEESA